MGINVAAGIILAGGLLGLISLAVTRGEYQGEGVRVREGIVFLAGILAAGAVVYAELK